MKIAYWENNKLCYRNMTPEEISAMQEEQARTEAEYWRSVDYSEAVDSKIRERYSMSQEFAILRQRDEKPDEYAAYYAYCEECKAYCKQMREKYAAESEVAR